MTDYTTSLRLIKPQILADASVWPTYINNDLAGIDAGINQIFTKDLTGLTSYKLVADGSTGDEARYQGYLFYGTLSGDCTITIPVNAKIGKVRSTCSGGNVILTTGVGSTATIESNYYWYEFLTLAGNGIDAWPTQRGATSIGTAGYYTFPGGLRYQWGSVVLINPNLVVTFPANFATTAYALSVTFGRNDGGTTVSASVGYTSKTSSGFTIITNAVSSAYQLDWTAVGTT